MSDSKDEGIVNRDLSRRSVLKWSGALAAAGIVGIGLGIGADLLIRPSVTKTTTATGPTTTTTATGPTTTTTKTATGPTTTSTTTSTSTSTSTSTVSGPTTTVTAPPVTLSYVPPLSPSVQTTVNTIIQNLVNSHQGESQYYFADANMFFGDLYKVVTKNGQIVGIVPEDILDTSNAREDAYLSASDVWADKGLRAVPGELEYASLFYINTPNRILYPMQRTGPRGDPNNANFVRITWDQALIMIANEIASVKSTYGPYSGYGGGVLSYYGMNVGTIGNVSQGNGVTAGGDVLGDPNWTSSTYNTLQDSKLIVLWGSDPTVGSSCARIYMWYYALAHEMGIPVIIIDPKMTGACGFADQWIPIRPGTDIAMMLAIANVWFNNNSYNIDYVNKFVEPTGFASWKSYVLGQTAGPDGAIARTPEWAAPICGVPADTITALANLLTQAQYQPSHLYYGWGAARQTRGEEPAKAAVYLNAMLGNIGVSGGWPGQAGILGDAFGYYTNMRGFGTYSIGAPFVSYGSAPLPPSPYAYNSFTGSQAIFNSGSSSPELCADPVLGQAIALAPQYFSGAISQAEFYSVIGNNSNFPAPNINFVMQFGGRYFGSSAQDQNQIRLAIQTLQMFVDADRHQNGSTNLADIVLPLTQFYEDEPSFVQIRRGFVYVQNIIPPPGETRPADWIEVQLANLLGVGAQYNPVMQNVSWEDWYSTIDALNQQAYVAWAAASSTQTLLGTTPPAWSDFLEQPVIRLPSSGPYVAYSAQISGSQPFATNISPISNLNSGKIEFYDSYYETFDQSKVFGYGWFPGWCCCAPGRTPMAVYEVPEESYFDPNVTTYPLMLLGNQHPKHTSGYMGINYPGITGEIVQNFVWISVSDAKVRGINNGDMVTVYNNRGACVLPAYVTSTILPGTVQMWKDNYAPNEDGIDIGASVNTLVGPAITAIPTGSEGRNALVQVSKQEGQG